MNARQPTSIKPRQRLVETADRLFYSEGIKSVGIDKVIAEAGVAKATLYSNFASKDDLILAVLAHREAKVNDFFTAAIKKHSQTTDLPLLAFFAALQDWLETPDFRGCAFINATVELADASHAGRDYCRAQKSRFKHMLEGFIAESLGESLEATSEDAPAGSHRDRSAVVNAVSLLVEGAIVTAQIEGTSRAAETARDAAISLLQVHAG